MQVIICKASIWEFTADSQQLHIEYKITKLQLKSDFDKHAVSFNQACLLKCQVY